MKTLLAGCAAVMSAAALLATGSAPAGAAGSGGHYLYPLAGDSQYLVYSQSHIRYGSKNFTGCAEGSPTMHVRDKAGHTRTLAVPHAGKTYDTDTNPCLGVLLNGDLLTLEGISGARDPMYWWNLKTGAHGVTRLPQTNIEVLALVPGGWVYGPTNSITTTKLYRQGTDGKTTRFATLPRFFVGDVATSTRGFVSGNDNVPLRYTRYGSSTNKVLDVAANNYLYKGCDAVTATFAACHSIQETDETGEYLKYQQSITPLSGQPTISSTSAFSPKVGVMVNDPAAAPGGVVALLAPTKTTSKLRGFGTGGRTSSAAGHGATAMVVAYGQIIVGHRSGPLTEQASVTGKQHTIAK